jgi:hypothetical protein
MVGAASICRGGLSHISESHQQLPHQNLLHQHQSSAHPASLGRNGPHSSYPPHAARYIAAVADCGAAAVLLPAAPRFDEAHPLEALSPLASSRFLAPLAASSHPGAAAAGSGGGLHHPSRPPLVEAPVPLAGLSFGPSSYGTAAATIPAQAAATSIREEEEALRRARGVVEQVAAEVAAGGGRAAAEAILAAMLGPDGRLCLPPWARFAQQPPPF